MNQNVQPAQPAGQTQAPVLQLSNGSSSFMDANPSELDFMFDEKSGNFMLDYKKPQQSTQLQTEGTEQQTANPQQQTAPQVNPYEDRFTRIEGALINLAGVLQGMGNLQPQQNQQTQDQQPELNIQSDDFATNLVNVINAAIEKRFSTLEEKLKPLNTDISRVNERLAITDLATKYGKPFVDMYPTLMEYKSVDPNANIEQLFLKMSKLIPQKDGNTQSTNGSNQNGQPQVDLLKKADQMSTIRDGVPNGVVTEKPTGKETLAQIVDRSINEIFNGR